MTDTPGNLDQGNMPNQYSPFPLYNPPDLDDSLILGDFGSLPDLTDNSGWQSKDPLLPVIRDLNHEEWEHLSLSDSGIYEFDRLLTSCPKSLKLNETSPSIEPNLDDTFFDSISIPNFQLDFESAHNTSTEILKTSQKKLPSKNVKKSTQNPRTLAANREAAKKYRAKKKVEEKQTLLEVKEASKKAIKLMTTFEVQEQNIIKMLKSSGFLDEEVIKDSAIQIDDNPLNTKNLKDYLGS